MPFHDENLTYEQLQQIARTHRCNECGNALSIAWGGAFGIEGFVLRCDNIGHSTIAKRGRTAVKGEETYEEYLIRETELEEKLGTEKTRALQTVPRTGQLTQSQAMHILKLVYPEAPEIEIIRCAILCRDFGLHPLMKEVYLIPFDKKDSQGRVLRTDYATVLGIGANRKLALDRKGAYSYLDNTPRAATKEEIQQQYGDDSEEEKANLISITKVRSKDGNEAIGFGLWPRNKAVYGTDKGNTKRNMANTRSERQALDRLPGEPLPQGVGIVDEAYLDLPEGTFAAPEPSEITEEDFIDSEISKREGEAGETAPYVEENQEAAKVETASPSQSKPSKSAPSAADAIRPGDLPDLTSLCKVCNKLWSMQPEAVWRELGYRAKADVAETPWEAFLKIKAVRE